jgi:hypothetical protein
MVEAAINTSIEWNIWKRCDSFIFNAQDETLQLVLHRCIEEVHL